MLWNEEIYRQTISFAGRAHAKQNIPGMEIPYLKHLACVTMETASAILNAQLGKNQNENQTKNQAENQNENQNDLDINFAIQCALLHDVIEDTSVSYEEVMVSFGEKIANGVLALTKNNKLPKKDQMKDSLDRILMQPIEIRIVKMADRVDNLYSAPVYWTPLKRQSYQQEARQILAALGGVNEHIETRLKMKIEAYSQYY